ncbi:FIST C-terminal domain-containing protein [Marinobacter hydrocarbonoclasticus]|nr:FIST C-terminal domain-containing protein [Marinobacter nauticus]
MKISTAVSRQGDVERQVREVRQAFTGPNPDLILVYYAGDQDASVLMATLIATFPDSRFLGCRSARGIMGPEGYLAGPVLGLWAMHDPEGCYGCSLVDGEPFQAARQAVLNAIEQAGCNGEQPALVWMHASPGEEEQAMAGIQSLLGPDVAIAGGSAADDQLDGSWRLMSGERCATQGVGIAVFYPTGRIHLSFSSGYLPSVHRGVVTACEGRRVDQIDHQPAFECYNRWLDNALSDSQPGQEILSRTSLRPLGRDAGRVHGLTCYKLSHPAGHDANGSLTLFTEVSKGETLILMEGSLTRLKDRASDVLNDALRELEAEHRTLVGGLVVFCAGCMMTINEGMSEVADSINAAIPGIPYLTPFTYGEQGRLANGQFAHGNLMISTVLFSEGHHD